jgi:monoamine oxidase
MKTTLHHALRRAFRLAQSLDSQYETPLEDLLAARAQHLRTRRDFLKTTARTSLLLGLGGAGAGAELLTQMGKPPARIAIVGAGLAGLSAGYHLRRKGVLADIFEGDKRAGGRVKSARIFDGGNLNTEIGAEFIDSAHNDLFWLVRALGLQDKIMDTEADTFGIRDAIFFENRHRSVREVVAELRDAYPRIRADRRRLGGRHAAALDGISLADYVESLPMSNWVKKMLHAAYLGENGLETSEQSAANLLSVLEIRDSRFLPFGDSDERFKIAGGNEQIPQGLAKILAPQIRYEHRLTALRENADGSLTLVFSENGTTREQTFDAVVMTLPFSVLRQVELQMELPPLKRRAIQELGYGTNSKFILETSQRTWRQAGYRGFLFNEQIPNGWDSAQLQQDNAGVGAFTCYFGGERGKNATKGTENEQLANVMPALDQAFPNTKASLTGKMELANWPSSPFVRGSYSCFRPGQTELFGGVAAQPVRGLHFAGEHCSTDFWGFMNGAAETGRKAAERVLRRVRR